MNLKDWQHRHGFTNPKAADALGVSLSTYKRMLKKETQHVLVLKAMRLIDMERVGMIDFEEEFKTLDAMENANLEARINNMKVAADGLTIIETPIPESMNKYIDHDLMAKVLTAARKKGGE